MRVDEAMTDELHLPGPAEPGPGGRFARGLAGSLAAGLVVLALVLGAGQLLASVNADNAVGGPGVTAVIGNAVAAVLAVAAAVVADRSRGALAAAAVAAVLVITGAVIWAFWLA